MSRARRPSGPLQQTISELAAEVEVDLTDLFALGRMLHFAKREAQSLGRQKSARLIEAAIFALPDHRDDGAESLKQ
jgi:hypothetical protein